jgi:Zn-finger nucleic acid-binding protein
MNRANFARCSGVIVDLCKKHGIWFDRDELSRIIEFINKGGLEVARSQEKIRLEEERRELQQMKNRMQNYEFQRGPYLEPRLGDIAAAGGLLKFLLR